MAHLGALVLDEHADDVGVSVGSGRHEGRALKPPVLVVQVGWVMVNQQAHLQPRGKRDTNRAKVSRGES